MATLGHFFKNLSTDVLDLSVRERIYHKLPPVKTALSVVSPSVDNQFHFFGQLGATEAVYGEFCNDITFSSSHHERCSIPKSRFEGEKQSNYQKPNLSE